MALKPPPAPWTVLHQLGETIGGAGATGDLDKRLRGLAQAALSRLDVVNREEFDAQSEILERTRARVIELETTLAALTEELEPLTNTP